MLGNLFSNTITLTKFIFKKERISNIIWILCIVALTLSVAYAFVGIFNSAAERQAMAETMKAPAMVAMLGPVYGSDNYTNGAMMSNMMLLFTIIGVAIMNILLVIKHTRRDEEEGREEVIRSLPVGRLSVLSATMFVSLIVNLVISLIVSFGLFFLQIESMDLSGSLVYGFTLGISGLFFATLTSLFCQLTPSSRGATAYSFSALGLSYLILAAGVGSEIATYISPLSFALKVQAYVGNYLWPLLVMLAGSILILGMAFILNQTRDLGEGLLSAKPGRKNASRFLKSPFGLSVRLTKNGIIGWGIGLYILGISYGSVDLDAFLETSDYFMKLLTITEGTSLTLQFITMVLSVMAIISAVPTLLTLLKVRSEEKKGRNEQIIARNISKPRLLGGYFILSVISSFLMLFLIIFGFWTGSTFLVEGNTTSFLTYLNSGMIYLPAIWITIGMTILLISYLPRYTGLVWAYLGFSFFAVYLGKLLELPDWVSKISPFGHLPQIPIEDMSWTSPIVLTVIAILFMAVGFIKYKKRDMIF